jgi:hypothetical protein
VLRNVPNGPTESAMSLRLGSLPSLPCYSLVVVRSYCSVLEQLRCLLSYKLLFKRQRAARLVSTLSRHLMFLFSFSLICTIELSAAVSIRNDGVWTWLVCYFILYKVGIWRMVGAFSSHTIGCAILKVIHLKLLPDRISTSIHNLNY